MTMEIFTIGGYNEVGKNMTCIKVDSEAVILDMGLHMENYINCKGDEDIQKITTAELLHADAIPDDSCLKKWKEFVRLIVPTHAHLDHVGAIPFMSNRYDAPIMCTPFTAEVIKTIVKDEGFKLKNPIKVLNPNSVYRLSKDTQLEFINVTHSTPQTVMAALHTKEGTVLYANDFKFDNYPTLGKKPNYKRLKELGKEGVKLLIVDGTRATREGKTPSESVAKQMLRDVLIATESKGKAVIVTTFSSHLARVKSIIALGKKMNRKVVLLGRSLAKYSQAGEALGIVNFSSDAEIVKYGNQVKKRLKQLSKERRDKYLLIVTGHQGEPEAVLSRIARGEFQYELGQDDHVVFSCSVIPNPTNQANREMLENQLKKYGVRIFKDIHASGHAAKEDLRDLINMVQPEHIIPAHGDFRMLSALTDLALEMGYKLGQNVHIMQDGQMMSLQ
ncbi:RNase J family beta-CASP ribonuclease [Candidatus Woesearchaeota archaeon]|nr:RNase J family beta-CASP ribonuclease [Candidatus Woesearchaeota archaeon]